MKSLSSSLISRVGAEGGGAFDLRGGGCGGFIAVNKRLSVGDKVDRAVDKLINKINEASTPIRGATPIGTEALRPEEMQLNGRYELGSSDDEKEEEEEDYFSVESDDDDDSNADEDWNPTMITPGSGGGGSGRRVRGGGGGGGYRSAPSKKEEIPRLQEESRD
jgi:hypothetical protein